MFRCIERVLVDPGDPLDADDTLVHRLVREPRRADEVADRVDAGLAGAQPFVDNGKAIALGEPEGMVKTIFDGKTGELLGAHMIGAEVTELIQGYTIAKTLESTESELIRTIFPHPTLSETPASASSLSRSGPRPQGGD